MKPWRHHDPIATHETIHVHDWTILLTPADTGGWWWRLYTPQHHWHSAGGEHTKHDAETAARKAITGEAAA